MSEPASINPHIIEGLYCEALSLADEARASFALSSPSVPIGADEDLTRIARSCEGLRTTTRIMHAIAWLLNQRSYLLGELSEHQLRRHGRLSGDLTGPDPDNLDLLAPEQRNLVAETHRFYARLLRLDREWRQAPSRAPSALETLQLRLHASTG